MSGFARSFAVALGLVAVCLFASVAVACPPVQIQSFGVHAQAVCPSVAVQSLSVAPQAVAVQSYAAPVQVQTLVQPFAVQAFAVPVHAVQVQAVHAHAVHVQAARVRVLAVPRRSVSVQKVITRSR